MHLLACRMSGDSLIWAAGNLASPNASSDDRPEECLLYYCQYSYSMRPILILTYSPDRLPLNGSITPSHAFPLLAIPFEFPNISPLTSMRAARYIYGCSMMSGTFSAALAGGAKIDALVKVDVQTLIHQGLERGGGENEEYVDGRSAVDIWESQERRNAMGQDGKDDAAKLFRMPKGWYAQEVCFVPRHDGDAEDDGWLLT